MVILMDIDKEPRRCCGAFVLWRKRWWAGDKGVLQYKWLCAQWRWCVPGCYDILRQSQVQDTQDCQHPWPDAGCQRLTLPEVRRQLQKQGYKSAEIKEHGIVLCSFSIACFAIWVGSFSGKKGCASLSRAQKRSSYAKKLLLSKKIHMVQSWWFLNNLQRKKKLFRKF